MHTRKRHRHGGAKLGTGMHGTVLDACDLINGDRTGTNDSLCEILDSQYRTPSEIVLYTLDAPVVITSDIRIAAFLHYIHGLRNTIAKIFIPSTSYISKPLQLKLEEELRSNRRVAKLYGLQAAEYTTVSPLEGFDDIQLIGARIKDSTKPTLYIAFGSKCNPQLSLKSPTFIRDILESIVVIQRGDYMHNDIKLDNIVQCSDRIKLVDWGASMPMTFSNSKHGAIHMISPIRYYCWGYPPLIAYTILKKRTAMLEPRVARSELFNTHYNRIVHEFLEIVSMQPNRRDIFERYKYSFDIFSLGLTILHAVILYNLEGSVYNSLITAFTSPIKPLNAKQAIAILDAI